MTPVLEIKNLKTYFAMGDKTARAVDNISLPVYKNKTTALVGESGSGKTVTALSILRLLPETAFHPEGKILFKQQNLLKLPYSRLRHVRGKEIAIIFQEPMTALNPVFTVGYQIKETLCAHRPVKNSLARKLILETMREVGLPEPEKQYDSYPHQLSGGMKQRIMIATAIINEPELIIADEPTTALDVTIQAQILYLLKRLKQQHHTSVLYISHDIGVVAETADFIAIMYGGQIMEYAPAQEIIRHPAHPYTRALFASLPYMNKGRRRLNTIPGKVAPAHKYKKGCRFADRCKYKKDICCRENPAAEPVDNTETHLSACFFTREINRGKI
ncbi:MAG TPA: ABC transporter ATP-binding protein [Spirochaetota bacterium]|nr:ABC transporter ATP-binding protein [Spirochaetota bacterium]